MILESLEDSSVSAFPWVSNSSGVTDTMVAVPSRLARISVVSSSVRAVTPADFRYSARREESSALSPDGSARNRGKKALKNGWCADRVAWWRARCWRPSVNNASSETGGKPTATWSEARSSAAVMKKVVFA